METIAKEAADKEGRIYDSKKAEVMNKKFKERVDAGKKTLTCVK